MIQRSVEKYPTFKIIMTSSSSQLFVSASVTEADTNSEDTVTEVYNSIAKLISSFSGQIIHERCFAKIGFQEYLIKARAGAFRKYALEASTPVTFVEGESCLENKFTGIQIRALKATTENRVWTIMDQGIPKGRAWSLDGSKFYMLQGVDGGKAGEPESMDRKSQSEAMFRHAERILRNEGANYQDVVRTWIYLSDILDWYTDFNKIRNQCYTEYGFLGNASSREQAEQIYLPASTGIEGRNPFGLPATMDVFAVHRSMGSVIQVRPLYGSKQTSAFRYGSAFSRAVVVEEPSTKLILVSGTASIDEKGRSLFKDDPAGQIRQTLDVVSALIAPEGATLQDLCEATVFFKRRQDYSVYQEIIKQLDIPDVPSVNMIANVCRDELLFELDAAFILEKDKA
jgi:enamine deaminase RidA (YjgF/YER057c/UK114 family)